MNGNIEESVNNLNNDFVNDEVNEVFADRAVVDSGSFLSHIDNILCKKHNLCVDPLQRVFSLGGARITIPLVEKGDTVMSLAYDISFAKRIKAPGRGFFHWHNL